MVRDTGAGPGACAAEIPDGLGSAYFRVDEPGAANADRAFTVSGSTDPMTFLPNGDGGVITASGRDACTPGTVENGVVNVGEPAMADALTHEIQWQDADGHNIISFSIQQ